MTEFEKTIGYAFKKPGFLTQALTHSSYTNERPDFKSNERFEFLGDSVLGMITAEYFFKSRRSCPEGELTRLRATAVCEKSLSLFAKEIGLGRYLLLGKGEINTNGSERPSILADAFEALIAAIYLDGGMGAAKKFVLPFIEGVAAEHDAFSDYKTILQEVIQQNPGEALEYMLISASGPDHDKSFEFEVRLNSNVIGHGKGSSKKRAEQQAAKEALLLMGYTF
ncbi:MAG: ribonuclease III [Oscillospiraceae bacterium]|jgi:ribonuclease-3|nr:ribonuclease III [Oscillospiraceae bacterium]